MTRPGSGGREVYSDKEMVMAKKLTVEEVEAAVVEYFDKLTETMSKEAAIDAAEQISSTLEIKCDAMRAELEDDDV